MDGTAGTYPDCIALDASTKLEADVYGARARSVVSLLGADLPVPAAWALSVEASRRCARSDFPTLDDITQRLSDGALLSLRSSPVSRDWGGPPTLLNIGMCDQSKITLAAKIGETRANKIYFRFIADFSSKVARLDEEDFKSILQKTKTDAGVDYEAAIQKALAFYELEMDEPFPQSPKDQLHSGLRAMAVAWNSTSAQILRSAKGAPSDAGLGLIIHEMVLGLGDGEFGAGVAQFVSNATGDALAVGRYKSQAQGRDALDDMAGASYLEKDDRGPSLEENDPQAFETLKKYAATARKAMADEVQLEFTIEDGQVWILDASLAERSGRASVRIAVDLVRDHLITKEDALRRISPRNLNELLHPQIHRKAVRDVFAEGIGASPGAATGRMVFSANAAQVSASRGEPCILVRFETSPDDIRGMHSANGILTERGGITSHAALVARGIGLPCVVGASGLGLDAKARCLTLENGEVLSEGDTITLDGSTGEVMRGAPELVEPELGGAFKEFMSWADEARTMGVRGNADTPADVRMCKAFGVDGIGLVRTEHMFFSDERLTVMRELIFAETTVGRKAALDLLLPMQRNDFFEIFAQMGEEPVCIRLLDPPLHEFLPNTREEMQLLAEAMEMPLSKVVARVEGLSEFNPMLGMRGVRLGVTVPEIYQMQARGIFEAAIAARQSKGVTIHPEIMIPLVSANREVEIVKSHVDAVATSVRAETGEDLSYSLGVMVETPRAALRAQDIARTAEFFSFGTNDLTQMTYGLSRDDAGRFMRDYVNSEVFAEDPFHSLDLEGVGELLLLASERGRRQRDDLVLGLCGEHGGDPASVVFCHFAGFDYVSCSAFRTPIARLAAAQAALSKS